MKFEIIKNSESQTGYKIDDNEFIGFIPGLLMAWQFEVKNVSNDQSEIGSIDYFSVIYSEDMPEEYARGSAFMESVLRNGYNLTGRVIFRGYVTEYWDEYEREWFVDKVSDEAAANILENMKKELARESDSVVESV